MVANDPSVYPSVAGFATGRIDLSPVVANEDNVLLMGEYGGVLFLKHQPGIYEAHTQVLPQGRGKWTLDMVNQALTWMFTRTDCADIMTRIPKGNHGARALAKAIHGVFEFRLERGWVKDGGLVPADIYSLQIQRWLGMSDDPALLSEGMSFHDKIAREYAELGKEEPQHPTDELHDRYAGVAALMIRAGQARKAVIFYNRWAAMAGYAPIAVVSENPTIIDIQEALIQVTNDGDFFVLRIK